MCCEENYQLHRRLCTFHFSEVCYNGGGILKGGVVEVYLCALLYECVFVCIEGAGSNYPSIKGLLEKKVFLRD